MPTEPSEAIQPAIVRGLAGGANTVVPVERYRGEIVKSRAGADLIDSAMRDLRGL